MSYTSESIHMQMEFLLEVKAMFIIRLENGSSTEKRPVSVHEWIE